MPEAVEIQVLTGAERSELDRLRAAIDASGDIIYEWDLATDAICWSASARRVFGLPGSVDVSTHTQFLTRVSSEDLPALSRAHDESLADGGSFGVEYRVRRGDGEFCWVEDHGRVHVTGDGRAERVVGSIRIITSHKQRQAQLERLTSYDELTGHYNRTRLREALDHALAHADRYETPGAYLAVAIDELAVISDVYGHDVADAAIIAVGRALDQCLRETDIVGRVAPDEFGVIIGGCPGHDVPVAVEKILGGVRRTAVRTRGGPIYLTVSVGGAVFPGTVRTLHDALTKAGVALERARRNGHNGFAIYDFTEDERSRHRCNLTIARQIQTALQTDRLELAFQPVVTGEAREVCFYECLIRMRDADGRHTVAGAFLRVAEEMGLVRLIDQRVLELAAGELYASPGVTLAINISGLTTTDPAWLRSLIALVKGRPEIASRLMIEITETAALHDMEETIRFVTAVRDLGCRIALDDFGAGYTSFRHLKAMAVDIVKIDGSFITKLIEQPEDFLFVKTLQVLAQGFGLKTVAECVESEEVAEVLAREGIDYLQGYHFGRPSFDRPWLRSGAPRDGRAAPAGDQTAPARASDGRRA